MSLSTTYNEFCHRSPDCRISRVVTPSSETQKLAQFGWPDVLLHTLCSLRPKNEIAKRTLLTWEESVMIGQARLWQGLSNKLDVDQFETERENAAARIAELKRNMIQKENELSTTL